MKSKALNRICGICNIPLTTKNTGELQWLQPTCNKCLPIYALECEHKFTYIGIGICILCGFKPDDK